MPYCAFREAIYKKVTKLRTLSVRWGAQPHSIAFGGVFPNITEVIFG